MFRLRSATFAALLVLAVTAGATPPKLLGFDDDSCAAWKQSQDDGDQRRTYVAWARGFLSGHNYANQRQQVTDVSDSTVAMFIERYCREKPTANFTDAAYRMSDQYSGRNAPITK